MAIRNDAAEALDALTPDAAGQLRSDGLSVEEVELLSAALGLWLRSGAITRRALARELALREDVIRATVDSVRMKLGVGNARGAEPLIAALAERDLLTSAALRRIVQRLARR